MTMEEENQRLREQVAERDGRIQHLERQLGEQQMLIEQLQEQMTGLTRAG